MGTKSIASTDGTPVLDHAIDEIETHVQAAGWDRPPVMFALVRVGQFSADEPEMATALGISGLEPNEITSIEQDDLPEGPLDEILAGIAWPDSVAGCALSQEILILPPSAESELPAAALLDAASSHPQRREARLVVGVLRDGSSSAVLRLRETDAEEEALLRGPDLAPNLVAALLATLAD